MKRCTPTLAALTVAGVVLGGFGSLAGCGGSATPAKQVGSNGGKDDDGDDSDDDDDDDDVVYQDALVEVSWDTYPRSDIKAFRLYFGPEGADQSELAPLGEIALTTEGFDPNAPFASFPTSADEELAERLGKVTCFTIIAVGNDNSESPASQPRCLDLEF